MKRPVVQIFAIFIGFATAIAAFNLLKGWASNTATRAKVIGHVLTVSGQVESRPAGTTAMARITSAQPLHHQELLATQQGSITTVAIQPDGPTLRLNENTRFIAELDALKPRAFIGTLLEGTITVLNPGKKDVFRLFRGAHEISLESAERPIVPLIPEADTTTAKTSAMPSASTAKKFEKPDSVVISATLPDESAVPTPSAVPSKDSGSNGRATGVEGAESVSEILTNDEIIKGLRVQTSFFQRCYLGFIHRGSTRDTAAPRAKGTVTLGFTIQNSGKVTDTQIVRSDFKDPTLHNCIRDVVERARFKTFKGAAVPVQEFPVSLQ